jgi:hypothetical protein
MVQRGRPCRYRPLTSAGGASGSHGRAGPPRWHAAPVGRISDAESPRPGRLLVPAGERGAGQPHRDGIGQQPELAEDQRLPGNHGDTTARYIGFRTCR